LYCSIEGVTIPKQPNPQSLINSRRDTIFCDRKRANSGY
jgi:hypothetical protein